MTIREALVQYMPWLLSLLSVYMIKLAGDGHKKTWLLGLFNQLLWVTWILASKSYGLLPMNAALWYMYIRNHIKWKER